MKKFAETVNKNGGVFLEARHRGKTTYEIQGLTSSPLIIFGDWVSPEDYATGIVKWKHENQRLRTLLDAAGESSKELLDINKKLRGDLGDAQGKLRGSEDYIKELKAQLEKQQPKIPEFVAKDIEEFRKHIETVGLLYYEDFMSHETLDWIIDIRNQAAFMQALSTGKYTVAKEKRFYLKNKLTGFYLYESKKGFFEQEKLALELTSRCDYTQQEIDNMDTGSYEQISVEVEE